MKYPMRKALLLALALLMVLLSGCKSEVEPTPAAVSPDSAAPASIATSGKLTALATIRPAQILLLSFPVSGLVSAVHAHLGMPVHGGDLLAKLDTAALELELQSAQEEVVICQAQLDQLDNDSPTALAQQAEAEHDLQLAEAEVALQIVRLRLEQAQEVGGKSVEMAHLDWQIATNALRDAQAAYSYIYWENESLRQKGIEPSQPQKDAEAMAWRRVEDAEAAQEQARLAYEQAQSTHSTSLSLLEAEIRLAQLRLEGLLDWQNPYLDPVPEEEEITQARARLRQAELKVTGLELKLQAAGLYAPFAGVISAVYLHPGEWGAAGAAVLEIVDTSHWQVETRNVSELSIGQVRVGQSATVQVYALNGAELPGQVVAISPLAVVQQGDTTYTLIIELEPTELNLWPGMNAQVEISLDP